MKELFNGLAAKNLDFSLKYNKWKNQSIVKIAKNAVRRKTRFGQDHCSLVAFSSRLSGLFKVLGYIVWKITNIKIPFRKMSLAYRDFVNVKTVEIAKKVEIGGVDSTNRAL